MPIHGPVAFAIRQALALHHTMRMVACWVARPFWSGCRSRRYVDTQRLDHGLILVLPGIEGDNAINRGIIEGLHDAGLPQAIQLHDWTDGRFALYNLFARARNRCKGAELAGRIREYWKDRPGRPVYLVTHSGGLSIGTYACEDLRDGESVAGIIALGPALSPTYDPTPALRHVDRGLWVCHSPHDWFYVGIGTIVFGTTDRRHCLAAGMVGFREPAGLSDEGRALYRAKLHPVAWQPEMLRAGHYGGHTGWTTRRFVRDRIAPIICDS